MVLLITGCRSGFGLGFAVEAARRGHTVYAGLRDVTTATELMARAGGGDVRPVQLDVTKAVEREAAVQRIIEEQGRLDGLVNNAGVALGGFLEQIDEDELRKVFDVNVIGAWALTRAVLPTLRAQGSGRIVMISSSSGLFALPGLGAYASSKFALEGMSEAWRHELRPFGIDVYLVEPGPYRTDIWGRNRTLTRNADSEGAYAALVQRLNTRMDARVRKVVREPDEVIERVVDLLDGPRQRLRHPMGPGVLQRRLSRLLPSSLIERMIQRSLLAP